VNLEAANILGRRRLRRSTQEGGEAADEADIIALRLFPQATHGHVFEHPPAQRADGRGNRLFGHRIFLSS
jgi:hypothetical protein